MRRGMGWGLLVGLAWGCGFDATGHDRGDSATASGSSSGTGPSGSASDPTAGTSQGQSTSTATTAGTTTGDGTDGTTTTTAGTSTTTDGSSGPAETSGTTGEPVFGPWEAPEPVTSLDLDGLGEDDPFLLPDMLTIYLAVEDNPESIYVARRDSIDDAWGALEPVAGIESPDHQGTPKVRADDRFMLLYRSDSSMVSAYAQVFMTSRVSADDDWDPPTVVPALDTLGGDKLSANPNPDVGRLVLCASGTEGAQHSLYELEFDPDGPTYGTPVRLDSISTNSRDCGPHLSADGLTIWFYSDRDEVPQQYDLYVATRPDLASPFADPARIDELTTGQREMDPWVSPDGRTLYFVRTVSNQHAIWRTTRALQ